MMSAPLGLASRTWVIRRSMALRRSDWRCGSGSVSRMAPASTTVIGHSARSVTRFVGSKGAYRGTAPSEVAVASAAPGPTAWTHVSPVARLSPRFPSCAL